MAETSDLEGGPDSERAVEAFRKLVARLMRMELGDVRERDIVITPYEGAYGWAGTVIAVEGSPPRGTILVPNTSPVFFVGRGRPRTLREHAGGGPSTILAVLRSHGFPVGCVVEGPLMPLVIRGAGREQ